MKIAVVLYGQPRNYLKGYNNIMELIKLQQDCKFDFFYHCWTINENETYKHSSWRSYDNNDFIYNENVNAELQKLYNPIVHEIENQSNTTLDDSLYKNTIAFNNTNRDLLNNVNNTLFQIYSRNKARNVLHTYLEKMDNKVHYDFVMTLRFDISVVPEIRFNELNKTNVYISNLHCPRKIMPDNCIVAPQNVYLEWFNIYDTLKTTLNNPQLMQNIINLREEYMVGVEQIVLAKYILHYQNMDNVSYFKGGWL